MEITNTTKTDIGLQPGIIVPAGGVLTIDNGTLTTLKALPSVKAHFVSGALVEDGAVEAPEPVTHDVPESPEDIDAIIDKDALRALLDAHETEYDGRAGVPKLQALLKSVMFVSE